MGCPAPACPPAHPLLRAQPVHRHTNVGERPMLARARQVTPSARSPRATQPARGRAPAAHTMPCSGCSAGAPLPLAAAPRAAGPSLSRNKRTPPSRCVLPHRGRARRARPLGRSPDSSSDARHALVLNQRGGAAAAGKTVFPPYYTGNTVLRPLRAHLAPLPPRTLAWYLAALSLSLPQHTVPARALYCVPARAGTSGRVRARAGR